MPTSALRVRHAAAATVCFQQILRDEWGFDGMVVSDCGAINDFYLPKRHGVAEDARTATALGVISGTDVECGSVYKHLPEAVKRGYLSEEAVDVCVRRLLAERFRLGNFDPDSLVEWTSIPMSVVDCKAHRDLALQAAREQMVLLKNNGVLPLDTGKKIMVMGPMPLTRQCSGAYITDSRAIR